MQQAARPWPGAAGPACPQPGARPRTQAWPTLGYILLLLACVREAAAAAGYLPRPGERGLRQAGLPWLEVPWQPLLTQAEVQRGMYYGSGGRLRALATKLRAGRPVTVVLLGGSVTNAGELSRQGLSYAARFFSFLNSTFPNPAHRFINRGMPSSNSGWFAPCVDTLVPPGADLVVVEFAVNDNQQVAITSPWRHFYEQLLRRLLALPASPAVVLLQHYSWYLAAGDGQQAGLFYNNPESSFNWLAQYYDVPSMSLRAAAWRLMQQGIEGFKVDQVLRPGISYKGRALPQADPSQRNQFIYDDFVHPGPTGHQLLAELLCAPLIRALWETDIGLVVNERQDSRVQGLPPPMIPNERDQLTAPFCAIGDDFQWAIVDSQGFNISSERPRGNGYEPAISGWVATQPGSFLVLQVDTRSGLRGRDAGRALVLLQYLRGNADTIGTAVLTCEAGCTCARQRLDATWPSHVQMVAVAELLVTGQSDRCLVRVTVAPDNGSRQLFFNGVMVNPWHE
ncbi:hypothetical protein ABPG77_009733 [Micractinium sp. CCAP 211/92]